MAGLFNGAPPPRPDLPSPLLPPPPLPSMPPDDEAVTPSADRQRFAQASGSNAGQASPGSSGRLQSILGDDWPWSVLAKSCPTLKETPTVSNQPDEYPSHGRSLTEPKPQTDRVLAGRVGLGSESLLTVPPTIDVEARNGDRFLIKATAPAWVAKTGMPLPVPGVANYEIKGWSLDTNALKSPPDVSVHAGVFKVGSNTNWKDTDVSVTALKPNQLTIKGLQPNASQIVRFSFPRGDITPNNTAIELWKLPPGAK
jgi:hypothetical protein